MGCRLGAVDTPFIRGWGMCDACHMAVSNRYNRNCNGPVWAAFSGLRCSLAALATVLNAAAEGLTPLKSAETCHMAVSNRNSAGLVWAAFSGLGCSLAALATVPNAAAEGLRLVKGAETCHMAVLNQWRACGHPAAAWVAALLSWQRCLALQRRVWDL